MKLIFNADDFGLSKGVNLGILEAYQNGLVRSCTMMAGTPGFEHGVQIAKLNPELKIGVHLTLTNNVSVGKGYKTITDEHGRFLSLTDAEAAAKEGRLDLAEVEAEFEAQIGKIINAGIKPDHFDSHHHIHNQPGIVNVFLKLAKKYDVKVRIYDKELLKGEFAGIKTTEHFDDSFYNEKATLEDLKAMISSYEGESLEVMSHPAFIDNTLYKATSYSIKRIIELDVLTSGELKTFVDEKGYEICSFSDL